MQQSAWYPKLLEKLRIEFTKSRARRSNDNALVATKNGAVVRKWMGYQFLPSEATQAIDTFYRQWLNPYLNFHRPCAFASERRDRRGKLRKVYAEWSTPWEKLLSLPAEQRGLRADRSLKKLQARADTCCRISSSLPSSRETSSEPLGRPSFRPEDLLRGRDPQIGNGLHGLSMECSFGCCI